MGIALANQHLAVLGGLYARETAAAIGFRERLRTIVQAKWENSGFEPGQRLKRIASPCAMAIDSQMSRRIATVTAA